ncbi:HAD family hydrolase [Abiotrophia sp.]|uniref:HAD family hydrolase n=1 Tax=Abiotrophia sp. TaxID=76631 RepID=UPI001CAD3AB6|nr:HAD family hydrolase [Abiotrophia sp.]MBF0936179.1 HAD family phosphatase [Abiotrophia sp.]
MIKHLFSDMDGTILREDGRISPETAQVIRQVGLPLTLVSARSPMEMREAIDQLGLHDVHVGFNGGYIFQASPKGYQVIHEVRMDYELAKTLVLDLRGRYPDLSISVFDDQTWFVDRYDDCVAYEQNLTGLDYVLVDYEDFFQAPWRKVFKLMLVTFDHDLMEEIKAYLPAAYPEAEIGLYQTSIPYLEVTPRLAQKSLGIQYIQEREGLTRQELMAFGDGTNDLAMFQVVGQAVVMANASEAIKAQADYVTLSNQEDGVAHALLHYLPSIQGK